MPASSCLSASLAKPLPCARHWRSSLMAVMLGVLLMVGMSPGASAAGGARNEAASAKAKKPVQARKRVVAKGSRRQGEVKGTRRAVTARSSRRGSSARRVAIKTASKSAARQASARTKRVPTSLAKRSLKARAGTSKVAYKPHRGGGAAARPMPTLASVFGLQDAEDPAGLRSSVAYLLDVDTGRVLLDKNANQVLPIASITKLMTVMVVLDAEQPLREMLTITGEDVDRERGSSSRLPVGTRLSRREMIQLALMASENRAANALGRHYPGGLPAFVSAMNAKARLLGLTDARFSDPTGLSGANVASARDLGRLLQVAAEYEIIREDSTREALSVDTGYRVQRFGNTNLLVSDDDWDIAVQKTGYISEAGRCLVMLTRLDGRRVAMVFLAAYGKYTRIADARRARRWLDASGELTALASSGSSITN
ncbi:MAG: serine hydrolase [Burkholderiaceae bacterium]